MEIHNDDYTSKGITLLQQWRQERSEYLVIKEVFAPVLEEINNLIAAGKVLVDGSLANNSSGCDSYCVN